MRKSGKPQVKMTNLGFNKIFYFKKTVDNTMILVYYSTSTAVQKS